jgi:hypothetical protein
MEIVGNHHHRHLSTTYEEFKITLTTNPNYQRLMLKITLPPRRVIKNTTAASASLELIDASSSSPSSLPRGVLIGLCGRKGSGKTTLVGTTLKRLLAPVELTRFAAPIKQALLAMGVPYASIEGDEKEKPLEQFCGKTGRQLMQLLGTEWGRDMVGEDLWLRLAAAKVQKFWHYGLGVLVDDVCFDDEADFIRGNGGIIINVTRPLTLSDIHRSKRGVNPTLHDMTFANDGPWREMVTRIAIELVPKIKLEFKLA